MTSGEALDSVAESESTPAKKRHKNVLRRRPRFRASIQSKLMVLLLLTSIVSVAAIAAIVYQIWSHFAKSSRLRAVDPVARVAEAGS